MKWFSDFRSESTESKLLIILMLGCIGKMRFYATALTLGFGWFAVLLIPQSTRGWILGGGGGPGAILANLSAVPISSLLTAFIFRSWIASARSLGGNVLRAISLPYAGCLIYLSFYNVYAGSVDYVNVGRINVHDSFVLYYWGLMYTALASYVIVPYSFFCQWILNRICRSAA